MGGYFDIQNTCGLYHPSTFQNIHKPRALNGALSFNYQAQSSFNSLLPPCHSHSEFRASESHYLCLACLSSRQPSYQTFMHRDKMNLSPTVTQHGLPYAPHQKPFDNQMHDPYFWGHWKASLNPTDGEEGFTPYLHQQEFDKAEMVLDQSNTAVDTELIFNTIHDAYSWRSRTRMVDPQSSADPTIPRTLQQKKAAVKLVFKAYKSVALATDNPGMLKAFEEQKHDNRHVETMCWSIVEGCIDRCDRGPLLNAYEPEKAKNNPSIKTFAERLNAIVESLSHQKTICKHLLDAPYLNRFLDDPIGSKQRVESNRKLNKRKGGVMDVGKKALGMNGKKGRPAGGENSNIDSDDEAEEHGSEYQELHANSSGVSSPFRTPDHPVQANVSSSPPRIGTNPLHSAERSRHQTPTPGGRRGRARTTSTTTPLRSRPPQYSHGLHYGSRLETIPNGGLGSGSPSLSMLQGSQTDQTLPSHTVNYIHGTEQSSGSVNPFETSTVSNSSSF